MTAPCDQPAQSLTMFRGVRMLQYTNVIGQTAKFSKVAFEQSKGNISKVLFLFFYLRFLKVWGSNDKESFHSNCLEAYVEVRYIPNLKTLDHQFVAIMLYIQLTVHYSCAISHKFFGVTQIEIVFQRKPLLNEMNICNNIVIVINSKLSMCWILRLYESGRIKNLHCKTPCFKLLNDAS